MRESMLKGSILVQCSRYLFSGFDISVSEVIHLRETSKILNQTEWSSRIKHQGVQLSYMYFGFLDQAQIH